MDVSAPRERQRTFAEIVGLGRREARLGHGMRGDGPGDEPDRLPNSSNLGAGPMPEDDPKSDLINGRYRLIEELGRGAMGVVYKAEDTKLDCFVALKFLPPRLAADSKARERLLLEARAASELHHPNICRIIDHAEAEDGRLYLVMAYYDGESLEEMLKRGPLPVERAVDIARQIAAGLRAAHRPTPRRPAGIVHRDIKPSNVLITRGDVAIILDFGIAKVAESGVTREGDVLGTIEYMSPEHLREGRVDAGTDLWALGVTLYEMLTGSRPFRGDYEAALLFAIVHAEPAPVQTLRPDVPEAVAEVVRRCMEKDPGARYQTAEEVVEALGSIHEEKRGVPETARPSRRRALLIAAVAVLGLLLPSTFPGMRTTVLGWIGGSAPPEVRHLAVLPLASATEEASVGIGLTYTLTSMLTQLGFGAEPAFTVVPAGAMRGITSPEKARSRFGVGVVVSGDFQQNDQGRAELMLRVVDTRTLRQLDSSRISSDLSELSGQALSALIDMLGVDLSADEFAHLVAGETSSEKAASFYLRGVDLLKRFDQPENVDAVVQLFGWALQDDSLYALAHAGLVEAYMWKYRITKDPTWIDLAERHGLRALELDERLALVRTTLGNLYRLTGDRDGAIREFRLALSLDPNSAEAYYGLAATYRALRSPQEAERYYIRSIALQPDDWRLYNDLGLFYLESGRTEDAAKKFARVIALAPDNEMGYEGLGLCFLYQGDLGNAELWLERSLDVKPTHSAYSNLGYIYSVQDRLDEEAQAYERALELDDSDYIVWGNLGSVKERMGGRSEASDQAYQRAIDLIERQLDVSPSDPLLLSDLASYHIELGQTSDARSILGRVSLNVSSDADLAQRVAVLHEKLGQRDQALLWVQEALKRGLPIDKIEADSDLSELRADSRYARLRGQEPVSRPH